MLTIIVRSLIIYLIVLLVFRLMGKRQLGQMQPFALVLTLIIADLATIPMAEVSVPVLHGVVPLLTLVVLHFVLTLISRSSHFISKIISGKPIIIVNPKGIDYKAMKKLNLSTDDIFEALRGSGYFNISQVQYAIMETNGKVSVMPKSEYAPVTNGDLKNGAENGFLPIVLVSEGKILKDNIALADVTEQEIDMMIESCNNKKSLTKDVLLLTLDRAGQGYLQMKKGEGQTFQWKFNQAKDKQRMTNQEDGIENESSNNKGNKKAKDKKVVKS